MFYFCFISSVFNTQNTLHLSQVRNVVILQKLGLAGIIQVQLTV